MLPIAPDTLLQQRYRILNLLEDDELGRTYLATDGGRADAYCALIEAIPSAQSPTSVAAAKEFFKREVTPLYQLQHPQIPRFWTTIEEQNRLFLVRDYVAGTTYAKLLEERRNLGGVFAEAEVEQFLAQILPPIGYVHSKGTIHQDLSLANIICRDRDRLPVIVNFGVLTNFINQLQSPHGHQLAIGQPGYAPAEQLRSGQISPSTDLYALAVGAIVMLTGKDPSALIEGDRINWNWRRWTQISDEFATVLSRMLSFEPEDRYQSALEVSQALQAIPQSIAAQSPAQRPSTMQTVAVGGKSIPPTPEPPQAAITNLDRKSIWEQPKVFIPAGIAIALLAGLGSWFGVSQFLHRPTDPVATTPPKQIDFNNPTIPTDSNSPSPTAASDVIQPEMNRSIVKEGNIDATAPVKYRIPALAGQNLDIQLIPAFASPTDPTQTTAPTDPTKSLSSPIDPLKPSPNQSKNNTATNPPISLPNSTAPATQVLMTILSPSGIPIDNQADRVVGWRGQIPASGDYTVELRPIKGIKGSIFPYKLSVTQVAVSPTPIPSVSTSPSPGSSLPPGSPPIEGNGIAPIPTNRNLNSVPNNLPGGIDSPAPSVTPTPTPSESPRPARRRRRNRVRVEPSPEVGRDRVESTEETPTPRRRRQVESTEEAPTPRRRRQAEASDDTPTPRRRQPESESKPSTSISPATPENARPIPVPEPSVAIPVPAAKSTPSQRSRPNGNSAPGNNIDPD
jgi:serine/threonine protein kinase